MPRDRAAPTCRLAAEDPGATEGEFRPLVAEDSSALDGALAARRARVQAVADTPDLYAKLAHR